VKPALIPAFVADMEMVLDLLLYRAFRHSHTPSAAQRNNQYISSYKESPVTFSLKK
jgi:hypothetical protein